MPPLLLDRGRIAQLVELAADRLDGAWLLVGGAAAAAWFLEGRITEDIDIIGLAGTQAERFALMELAADAGLPIEAMNSAADFFIHKIDGWRDELVVLRQRRATIYRPSATLFLLLKIMRLSAVDLDDCVRLLEHCHATGEPVELARVGARIDALAPTTDDALRARRARLRAALG